MFAGAMAMAPAAPASSTNSWMDALFSQGNDNLIAKTDLGYMAPQKTILLYNITDKGIVQTNSFYDGSSNVEGSICAGTLVPKVETLGQLVEDYTSPSGNQHGTASFVYAVKEDALCRITECNGALSVTAIDGLEKGLLFKTNYKIGTAADAMSVLKESVPSVPAVKGSQEFKSHVQEIYGSAANLLELTFYGGFAGNLCCPEMLKTDLTCQTMNVGVYNDFAGFNGEPYGVMVKKSPVGYIYTFHERAYDSSVI